MPVLVERTLASKTLYQGRVVRLELLDVATDDGRTAKREIIRHAGATVVLSRLPDGHFIFVRQFRKAIEATLVEAIAGGLEPGETPEECARREVAEESGYTVARIQALGPIVCCPGYSSEVLHGFLADVDAAAGDQSPDEDENLEVLHLAPGDVEAMIADGRIWDGKTIALWMLYRLKGK
jgi:ADP-ribose pyrophosphatase